MPLLVEQKSYMYLLFESGYKKFMVFFYSRYPDLYEAYNQFIVPPDQKSGQVRVDRECPEEVKNELNKIVKEYYAPKNN